MTLQSKVKVKCLYIHFQIVWLHTPSHLTFLMDAILVLHSVCLRQRFWIAGMTMDTKFKVKTASILHGIYCKNGHLRCPEPLTAVFELCRLLLIRGIRFSKLLYFNVFLMPFGYLSSVSLVHGRCAVRGFIKLKPSLPFSKQIINVYLIGRFFAEWRITSHPKRDSFTKVPPSGSH